MKTNVLVYALVCLGLSACDSAFNLDGSLKLNQKLVLKTTDGKIAEIPAGDHMAQIKLSGKNLEIRTVSSVGSKATKLKIKLPKEQLKDVQTLSQVDLTAAQLGQEFGVRGFSEQTTVQTGPEVSKIEACGIPDGSHEECGSSSCSITDSDCGESGYKYSCDQVSDYRPGLRNVTYFPTLYSSLNRLTFVSADGSTEIGNLSDIYELPSKQYTKTEDCHD